jgi:hypothetical protein
MSPQAKWEYYAMMHVRYHKARNRKEKSQILSEFCQSYSCHRKHALRLLNGAPPQARRPQRKKRKPFYSPRIISMLESVWQSAGFPWSVRLKAILRLWLPWVRERFSLTPEEERQLLSISPAQIDRRLQAKKQWVRKKVYGSTRSGTILKHQIPIRTDSWNIRVPGFMESDLVSHCGGNASGLFAYTLDWDDIQSQWVERRAFLGRGQFDVLESSQEMEAELPFRLRGLDCDNDSSFINEHLFGYCHNRKIQFTRSRPYKKNDNAHIEQKNNTHVRQILGYVRYDTQEAVDAINDLYKNELRIFQNYFQPSVKLVKKIRIGSKVRKKYDAPQTPYQRLLQSKKADSLKLEIFKKSALQWNPFLLSDAIESKLSRIYGLASKTQRKPLASPPKRKRLPLSAPVRYPSAFPLNLLPTSPVQDLRRIYKKEKFLQTW